MPAKAAIVERGRCGRYRRETAPLAHSTTPAATSTSARVSMYTLVAAPLCMTSMLRVSSRLRRSKDEPILNGMSAPVHDAGVALTPARVADVLVATSRSFSSYLENEVGSRAVTNEILQDAFGRGTHNIDVLNPHESALGWFYRLLRNAVIDQPRSAGVSEPQFNAFRAQIEQQLEPRAAMKDAILGYVGALSAIVEPEYAAALRSVELDGKTVDAFAEANGISTRLAGVQVSDARAAVRRCVVRSAGICTAHGCWNCTCGLGFIGYGQARAR